MGSRKSTRCHGKISGQPVTEYDSESEALAGAQHARSAYQKDLVPYPCNTCGYWHLAPRGRQTPSTTCYRCVGADGRQKEAYASEHDAETRATILYRERGIHLRTYLCQYGQGWHLTKG